LVSSVSRVYPSTGRLCLEVTYNDRETGHGRDLAESPRQDDQGAVLGLGSSALLVSSSLAIPVNLTF
jgi:hypothetical protein